MTSGAEFYVQIARCAFWHIHSSFCNIGSVLLPVLALKRKKIFAPFCNVCIKISVSLLVPFNFSYFRFKAKRKNTFFLKRKKSQHFASRFTIRYIRCFFRIILLPTVSLQKKIALQIFVLLPNRFFRRVVAIIGM